MTDQPASSIDKLRAILDQVDVLYLSQLSRLTAPQVPLKAGDVKRIKLEWMSRRAPIAQAIADAELLSGSTTIFLPPRAL